MPIMLIIRFTLLFLFIFSGTQISKAQEPQQIRLLDMDDNLPIIGVTFKYGEQRGVSDTNGIIRFKLEEGGASMFLSHLSYGEWVWEDDEIKELIKRRVYYRKNAEFSLYPVTVIAVKEREQPDTQLGIGYPERMEHDGANILNQLPAFNSIRKSGSYGMDPVFRGYKYDQLNVVMNGAQSATAACPNRMDPPTSQMAPNMMDRIEVLKGPHSLRYGTGFGGTINFIPAKLQFSQDPVATGRISSGYEGNGRIFRSEGELGMLSERFDMRFFGSWSGGDDYQAGNGRDVQADFSRGSIGSNIGIKLGGNQQLRLSGMYNVARDADFAALPMDLRDDDTWMFNARHDILIQQGALQTWNTTVFASFVDHLMNNLQRPAAQRNVNAETNAETYNFGGRTESIWQFTRSKLYAGADLRVEGASGTRVRTFLTGPMVGNSVRDNAWQDGQIARTGLFAEYHLSGSALKYVLSGRLEMNQSDIRDVSQEFAQLNPDISATQWNLSLSAGAQKSLSQSLKLGLWLGRAQRSGSLTERFINFFPVGQDPFEILGNPNIDPEINNQLDLTLEWNRENTALNLDVFGSYLQNYISSIIDPSLNPRIPMSPGVRRVINIDEAFKTGFEISWVQQLFNGTQQQLSLAYTYAQDLERDEALPEIPPMDIRYKLKGTYLNNLISPEVSLRYVLQQNRVSQEFGETVTPDFLVMDLNISYNLTNNIRLNAGVNNLFNENYFEHLNRSVRGSMDPIFAPGRNIYTNLSIQF
jgi:iron complex outermembrane receptor protein